MIKLLIFIQVAFALRIHNTNVTNISNITNATCSFSYGALNATDPKHIKIPVKNNGTTEGKEIVNLYVSDGNSTNKTLRTFEKIYLKPNQTKNVTFELSDMDMTVYNGTSHEWDKFNGSLTIYIGDRNGKIMKNATLTIEENANATAALWIATKNSNGTKPTQVEKVTNSSGSP